MNQRSDIPTRLTDRFSVFKPAYELRLSNLPDAALATRLTRPVFCILSLWMLASAAFAQAQTAETNRIFSDLRELREQIDESQLALNELLFALEFDPELIIRFVANDIAYQPYAGTLRGARGVLVSRSGNALDQALLLATLLRDAGFEARIVEGRLLEADAAVLRDRTAHPSFPESPFRDPERARTILDGLGNGVDAQADVDTVTSVSSVATLAEVPERARALIAALRDAGVIRADVPPVAVTLPGNAQPYHWVQFQQSAGPDWQDLHPAFGDGPGPAEEPEVVRYIADSIPQELVHRFSIQSFATVRRGESESVIALMSEWKRPVANLWQRSVSYTNFPDGLALTEGADPQEVAEALERVEFFHPLLNDAPPSGAQAFDLAGNVLPPEAAASAAAGVFAEVSAKTNSAAAALSGLGAAAGSKPPEQSNSQGLQSLARQWIRIGIHPPGEQARYFERVIYDENVHGDMRQQALAREVTLSLSAGRLSPTWQVAGLIDAVLAVAPAVRSMETEDDAPSPTIDRAALETINNPADTPLWSQLYFTMVDQFMDEQGEATVFRATPAVVASYRPLALHDPRLEGFDIVTDTPTFDVNGRLSVEALLSRSVRYGLRKTLIESRVAPWPSEHTLNAYEQWPSTDSRIVVLRRLSDLDAVAFEAGAEREVRRALDNGNVVLVVTGNTSSNRIPVWWQFHPESLALDGMIHTGMGGAMPIFWYGVEIPEYLKTTMATLIATVGKARAMGALSFCLKLAGIIQMTKMLTTASGLAEALPPEVAAIVAGLGVALQSLEVAGGMQFFMQRCVLKVATGI